MLSKKTGVFPHLNLCHLNMPLGLCHLNMPLGLVLAVKSLEVFPRQDCGAFIGQHIVSNECGLYTDKDYRMVCSHLLNQLILAPKLCP